MFDALTIAAVADQISNELTNGRIQRIGLADDRTLVVEVYARRRRRTLVASADDQRPRVLLSDAKPPIDPTLVTPFGLLLRKYARGGIIVGVEQPPLERLVRVSIAKRIFRHNATSSADEADRVDAPGLGEEGQEDEEDQEDQDGVEDAVFVHLVVEIMGRHSNLILVDDDGRVMESVKRVTARMSRVRQVLPRIAYVLPPPPDKLDPRRITTAELRPLLSVDPAKEKLASALVRRFRGISPQMGREIAYRATGEPERTLSDLGEEDATAIAREMRRLVEPLLTSAWSPKVYRNGEGAVVGFAPVPMSHLAQSYEEESVETISNAAELAAEGSTAATPIRHDQRRDRLTESIRDVRKREMSRLSGLKEQRVKAEAADELRTWGELIYAYLWKIKPGDARLDADGVDVPLDPALTPKENAQEYFERYRKGQGAAARTPAMIERGEAEIAYLDQLLIQVSQAETFTEIEALVGEWEGRHGKASDRQSNQRMKKTPPSSNRPNPLVDAWGNTVFIGRSGPQNDAVTFDIAGPNDTWLHARGVPGSHVIVRWQNPTGDENEETLLAAASLAAFYSAGRGSGHVEVDLTRRRYVRKIKGTGPGMVTYRNERTVAVRPADEADILAMLKHD